MLGQSSVAPMRAEQLDMYFVQHLNPGGCFCIKKGKTKAQGVQQSQTAAFPRHQEEEETEKTKQSQIEQTYETH